MMQTINLSDEQQLFRASVRQFAVDKIAPLAAESDRTAEFSWPAFDALKSMELTTLSYPIEYGGSNASLVEQAIVAEELARVDASASLMFMIFQARHAAGPQFWIRGVETAVRHQGRGRGVAGELRTLGGRRRL